MNTLYAFYDLQVSPPSFDIASFIVLAEAERKRTGCDAINFVIVPGANNGFRPGNWIHTQEAKEWRRDNILVPCCRLLPSCKGVMVCAERGEAAGIRDSVEKVFPQRYVVENPQPSFMIAHLIEAIRSGNNLCTLRAKPEALRYVRAKLSDRRFVAITLRECDYEPARNSNIAAWAEFARSLGNEYLPVFVGDTEKAMSPIPLELGGFTFFNEAAWNIDLRMGLYEASCLSMSVSGGPTCLALYGEMVRALIFKMITPAYKVTSEKFLRSHGLPPDSQLTPNTRLIWEDDNAEILIREFRKLESEC